jgi:hypothetical protein
MKHIIHIASLFIAVSYGIPFDDAATTYNK